YFRAGTDALGNELWRTDGNTVEMVGDIAPGEEDSGPAGLIAFGGRVYFSADDDEHGVELWATDGGKPYMVRDILPGDGSGSPWEFTPYAGSLYFSADDGTHGSEMWRVTADNSVKVKVPASTIKVDLSGRARVAVRCAQSEISGPCRGTVIVKTKVKVKVGGKRRQLLIGKGKFSAAAGKAGQATLKLTRQTRKLLRKYPAARKVTVRVKAQDSVGNKTALKKAAGLTGPGAR
ncbi:MAG TPA: hypothetical protein P5138_08580, partial [Solirubrobacterales bacterium]|nr:hypothetical protein [Solirubrobacterales bacterium]